MNITYLDAYTLNPGDLSWDCLEQFGNLNCFDRTPPDQIVERCLDADIILSNKVRLNADHFAALPKLKYIAVTATGYDIIDVKAAKEHQILVSNAPAYSQDAVPQFVFSYILEWASAVAKHSDAVHNGDWVNCPDFSFTLTPLIELKGLTIGIVGFGSIGQQVARIANGFGMNILVHTRTEKETDLNVKYVSKETLFSESDVITLHCPLNENTFEIVNQDSIAMMKNSAFLVNTGRGQLVNEAALASALNNGKLAGAGVDVLSTEPPQANNPLLDADNCFITPHLAWATEAARKRMMSILVRNIQSFLDGEPENIVNK